MTWARVVGGGAQTIQFGPEASAVDDFYRECWVDAADAGGHVQRRRIGSYLGKERLACVEYPWAGGPPTGEWAYCLHLPPMHPAPRFFEDY